MSTIKPSYGAGNQTIVCTLTSLANGSAQGSNFIDNTSALYLDALVFVTVKTNGSSTSATGSVNIYGYGSVNGSTFTDNCTGSNGGQPLTSPPNTPLLGVGNAVANATTYDFGPFSFRSAFNGIMPQQWGIVVVNATGNTLDASVGSAFYQGYQEQVV